MLPSLDSARRSNSLTEQNVSFYPASPIGGDRNRQRKEELTSRRPFFDTSNFTLAGETSCTKALSLYVSCSFFPDYFVFRLVLFLTCGRQPPWSFLCIVFSSVCGGRQPPYSVCSFVSVLRGRQPPYRFFVYLKFYCVWLNRITFLFHNPWRSSFHSRV